jgi:hypothetical protein
MDLRPSIESWPPTEVYSTEASNLSIYTQKIIKSLQPTFTNDPTITATYYQYLTTEEAQ